MSWTLFQQVTYTADPIYRSRLGQAFLKLANDIVNENPATTNHAQRLALAVQVISGNGVPPRCYPLLPVLNPALQVSVSNPETDPTDNDLLFTVSTYWDYFAGV